MMVMVLLCLAFGSDVVCDYIGGIGDYDDDVDGGGDGDGDDDDDDDDDDNDNDDDDNDDDIDGYDLDDHNSNNLMTTMPLMLKRK